MDINKLKRFKRKKRHQRVRERICGTEKRPRLYIHRSLKHLYAQIIDDTKGKVLYTFSTLNKEIKDKITSGGNITAARILGEFVAERLKEKVIKEIVFDRGPYPYVGRIKAFAESLRKRGLIF
ncbi:MAG: 50S ribosomal protein L18 [Candidatus Omnitrophica bacterium]|nr:50S ribosomal protein L18 [Candidatus Omnitrophota bacterium]